MGAAELCFEGEQNLISGDFTQVSNPAAEEHLLVGNAAGEETGASDVY